MKRFVASKRSLRALCSAAAVGGALFAGCSGALAQNRPSVEAQIQQKMNIRNAAVVKLNVLDVPGIAQQVVVPIAGQLVTLDLLPHAIRAEGYTLWEQREDQLFYRVDAGPESTWRGSVLEMPGSLVAGGLVKGGIFARVIIPDGREFWIEHIGGRIDGADNATHIIYTHDSLVQGDHRCGNTVMPDRPAPKPSDGHPVQRGATLDVAQMATDADWEYFQDYGGTTWVTQRIAAITNTMNVAYERDVNITHTISQSVVRTTAADPYTTTDPATLNAQVQAEWNGMAGTRDVIQLFTGRDIDGNVIGRANAIGSICAAGTGASNCYSQSDFNGNFMSACDLSQHELGHLWDATHCTCSNPASTMNPSITSINRFTESTNDNIGQIIAYRNSRACLSNASGTLPRNNDCADGVPISAGRFGFNNVGATTDPAPVPTACGSMGDDIWYTFLAPCDGTLNIDTCNNANESGFDTVIAAYTGSCSSLTLVECNDDDTGCTVSSPARRSLINFPVTRNTLYRIRVGGFSGVNGEGILDVDLTQSCPASPPNDTCATAITITECDGIVAFSNVGAESEGTVEVTDCNFSSSQSIFNDMWYRVVAPCTGTIRVSSCGSAIDTKIAIYTSCPSTVNSALACNDDNGPACAGLDSSVEFLGINGADYFIRVGSYNPATTGNISLRVSAIACPIPTNDICSEATATPVGLGTHNFSNINACAEGALGCGSGLASVWYKFIPETTCTYQISTCNLTTLDTVVGVYAECSSTTPISCVDDFCGLQTQLTFPATAGFDYWIRIHGFGGATASGQFSLTGVAPANDLCANAATASLGVNAFDNRCANGEAANGCGSGLASVFYSFTSPVTATLNVSTCGLASFDTVLSVYASCAATTSLACNDDACAPASRLSFNAVAGATYIIRVHGFGGSQGTGSFRIGPDNDECENPLVITNGSNTVTINGATQSGANIGCLIPFADVWMSYTATCTGNITVNTCGAGTNFDTVLSAYNGLACPVTPIRQQGCNDDFCGARSSITFPTMAGRPYLIRLSNFATTPAGTANVTVSCALACPCNFNGDGFINSQDFFDFIACFFGGPCPAGQDADYNNDGFINSQDFFDFTACLFNPSGFGC